MTHPKRKRQAHPTAISAPELQFLSTREGDLIYNRAGELSPAQRAFFNAQRDRPFWYRPISGYAVFYFVMASSMVLASIMASRGAWQTTLAGVLWGTLLTIGMWWGLRRRQRAQSDPIDTRVEAVTGTISVNGNLLLLEETEGRLIVESQIAASFEDGARYTLYLIGRGTVLVAAERAPDAEPPTADTLAHLEQPATQQKAES